MKKDIQLTSEEIKVINIALNVRERDLASQVRNWSEVLKSCNSDPTKGDLAHYNDLMDRYFQVKHINDTLRSIRD
jgi:hypothetical protein